MEWRIKILKAAMVVLFAALLLRVGYIQLHLGERYMRQSEENRLRVKDIDPLRGLIFDRKGRIMVENRPGYTIVGTPSAVLKNPQTLSKLRDAFCEPEDNGWETLAAKRLNKQAEIRLKRDIEFAQLAAVEASMLFLPGIEVKVESKRHYSQRTAAHILGYLGEISSGELSSYKGFLAGDIVGKYGVEKIYNSLLFGQRGFHVIEVDAAGNKIRDVRGIKDIPAVNGSDIYLTIDLDLQRLAEELLEDKSGAVVALDPSNGDILAMVSAPDYDPEVFSGMVRPEDWNMLVNHPGKPLLNRAVQGTYPPGSTVKMAILAAALQEGVITTEQTFHCPGYYQLGERNFKCWREAGHGHIKALPAIEQSCDVYFYNLGLMLGIDKMAEYLRNFGFGAPTGIDIEGEASGLVPDSAYKNRRWGEGKWTRGHLLNTAIGQGDVLVTPLQLAVFCAALANGGYLPEPHLLKGTVYRNPDYWKSWKPSMRKVEGVSPEAFDILRRGMNLVVQGEHGTAHWLMNPNLEIAGKTGTAQNPHGEDHAWFIGFAPFEDPVIAVCALVEHGEHGSTSAAPIVMKIIHRYLQLEKPKKPPSVIRTVG